MTSDYYDPHPRFHLEQSLVLVGHPGAGAARVAHELAARTGLPLTEVERWAESSAGMSRARLLVEQGLEALRASEADAVRRSVARQPRGFISMGSGCLEAPDTLALVVDACCLVFVRRPLDVLHRRLSEQLARAPGSVPELLAGAPASADALAGWLEDRRAAESAAHVLIEAGDRHPSRLADELLGSLGRLRG